MAAAFEVTGLTVDYGAGVKPLDELTATIRKSVHTIILGPSGSGKTTLLGCLAGQIKAASGSVKAHGRIARIHQNLHLVPQLSALENVLHGALGRTGFFASLHFDAETRKKAVHLLHKVGLSHRVLARVKTLSGGEAQRVAIARALMQQPDILLADEPVAALDPHHAEEILQLLKKLQQDDGLTIVTVLHHADYAQRYGDDIIRLGTPVAAAGLSPVKPADMPAAQNLPDVSVPSRMPASLGVLALAAAAVLFAWPVLEASPTQLDGAATAGVQFLKDLVPSFRQLLGAPWPDIATALLVTLRMALLATLVSALMALPLAALAARNVAPPFLGAPLRLLLNIWRAIPSIIWALIFVAAVGVGAIAGTAGLAAYSLGYLTKFFYESFEAVEKAAPAALAEMGASGPQRFVHAVWPSARPVLAGHCLFMLEYNVRAASILGIVGAGGIGQLLKDAIDIRNLHVAGVILVVLATVTLLIDALSGMLRKRIS